MPELRSMSSVKSDLDSIEIDKGTASSPARSGGSSPGPDNKPSGETMSLRRTKGKYAHAGDGVTRQIK